MTVLMLVLIAACINPISAKRTTPSQSSAGSEKGLTNEEALNLSKGILNFRLCDDEEKMDMFVKASGALLVWLTNSKDFSFSLTPPIIDIVTAGNERSKLLLQAYMAAETYVCLSEGKNSTDRDSFIKSMKILLKYYNNNKAYIGENKILDSWNAMMPTQLEKELKKLADEK